MKTLELKLLSTPVLLVWGLPEDAADIEVIYNKSTMQSRLCYKAEFVGENRTMYTALIKGNWQLISKLSELTEDDCKGLVPEFLMGYEDYTFDSSISEPIDYFHNAKDSFISKLKAEGYYVKNPHEHPDKIYTNRDDSNFFQRISMKKWKEAQSKTLPENTLIFKRV